MPGIDTSIYSNLNKPADPLGMVGNTVGLANQFTNRQLLQTELQRQQLGLQGTIGQGEAYQGAVDANGNFDAPTYNRLSAANGARWMGPANAQASGAAAQAGTAATAASTALGQGQQNWAVSNILPLFNDPKNPPRWQDVGQVIIDGIHSGALDSATGNALYRQVLRYSNNPGGLKSWAQTRFAGSLGPSQVEPAVTVTTPTGGSTVLTKGQTIPASQGGASPTGAPSASPGITTGPPTGVNESYVAATTQKNQDYNASHAILGNARNLEAAADQLDKLNPSDAGSIGAAKNAVLNNLVSLGFAPSTAAMTYQEAEKYLEKSKANLPAAQRSDMAQHLADVSNPNLATSLAATKALTRSALGFSRMDAAVPFAWDATHPNEPKGQTDPAYLQYRAKFMSNQDPDGFVFDRMSPTEQRQIIAEKQKEGAPAFARFRNSVATYGQALDRTQGQQ